MAAGLSQEPRRISLGLPWTKGKSILACLQQQLVPLQAEVFCRKRRLCQWCRSRRSIKDRRSRQLTTLFGTIHVHVPSFAPCRRGTASRRTVGPLAELIAERRTPEYERVLAKDGRPGSLRAAGRADGRIPSARKATGDRDSAPADAEGGRPIGTQVLKAKPPFTPEAKSIAVSVDGGHVKSIRSYQVRSFEVLLSDSSNDRGQHQLFSSVAAEADRECLQWPAI